ncbi:hypothetical protein IDJ77_24320 [Mucilaginibacter sp. ZT4R22]|uniref:Uncharacterized protein n=1 Tax=Mucilaginibacter pankratovii TaxID=2772110 RepID=A0ABR7WXF4_9SPHI|nr:hypothetical protein [Mucilaginibacter pankratovii]MBD1366958.1 hypothetical protein [Mucilaginibacter pankratovii]
MKTTPSQASASKLVNRFDKELRTLLMNDLKAIRSVKEQIRAINANGLTAA